MKQPMPRPSGRRHERLAVCDSGGRASLSP